MDPFKADVRGLEQVEIIIRVYLGVDPQQATDVQGVRKKKKKERTPKLYILSLFLFL